MAGYSGTPLVRKLGIRAGDRARFVGAPPGYRRTLGPLPEGASVVASTRGTIDFIQLFAPRSSGLRRLPDLKRVLAKNGALWICWPKKASGVETDLTEGAVRAEGLAAGLVDVKICAVDHTWSGLKFVFRVKDR